MVWNSYNQEILECPISRLHVNAAALTLPSHDVVQQNHTETKPAAVMPSYILGLDVGTTSIKAILLDRDSRCVAATHSIPTTSDISDSSGIKVSVCVHMLHYVTCISVN